VLIKLRVFMTPQGQAIRGSRRSAAAAPHQAIEFAVSAIAALKSCQPYAMLPPDRYGRMEGARSDVYAEGFRKLVLQGL